MNKTQALSILSEHYSAEYVGTYVVPACSGNLIEDIMNEDSVGKTYHKWNTTPLPTVVDDNSVIALAKHYV
jgi:hypothetical protein